MATPQLTPQQQIQSDLSSLQSKLNDLQSKVQLASVRDSVENLEVQTSGLVQRIKDLRAKGYVFEKTLEPTANDLHRRWLSLRPGVQNEINKQFTTLQSTITPIENDLRQVAGLLSNISFARNRISASKTAIETLENRTSAIESSINGMFDSMGTEISKFTHHLDDVQEMFKNLGEACFQLFPTEAGVMAVKGVWSKSGKEAKEDPEGVLYLTDQRLIFEQKQNVATKKVLFITTEKKMVQQLQFEVPLDLIVEVKTHKAGALKNEDNLDLKLKDAFTDEMHVHIWQDCNEWLSLINRVKAGDFDKERAIPIDKVAQEKASSAPTQCPKCGGAITKPVLRGQDSITCEFCGAVIRL